MKTYNQILNELKIKTMQNYVNKASQEKSELAGISREVLMSRSETQKNSAMRNMRRKYDNRSSGINTAKSKIKNKLSNLKIVHNKTVN